MQYTSHYQSPLGRILLAADNTGLTGLWFEGQKYFALSLNAKCLDRETPLLANAKRWLDLYFTGKNPDFPVSLHLMGTEFQKEVWKILCTIPYGKTTTYGDIARQIARKRGLDHMSAQAVGGAVGHNPVSIIVPCHRVLGTNGSLTGYAGGIDKKNQSAHAGGCRTSGQPASCEGEITDGSQKSRRKPETASSESN